MRTNIEIDDELMSEVLQASGKSTKKEAVEDALKLFVQLNRQARIRELRGKVEFWPEVTEERKRKNLEFDQS